MQNVKNTSFAVGNPDGMYSKEREAFETLKPQDRDEAFHYLTILENAFVKNWLIINEYKKISINVRKDSYPLFKPFVRRSIIVVSKMSTRIKTFVRLKEEDKAILRKLASYYDVSESDAVKIAIKHLAKELGLLSS